MVEEIRAMLHGEDGIFNRIRDGILSFSEEEERKLIAFSEEVNCHMRNNNVNATEVAICFAILSTFLTVPKLSNKTMRENTTVTKLYNLALTIYHNLICGIDF